MSARVFPVAMTAENRILRWSVYDPPFMGMMPFLNCSESTVQIPSFSVNEYDMDNLQCKDDELIVVSYSKIRCIDVYVNSISGKGRKNSDGILIGPEEIGEGSIEKPFCNLNTAYRLAFCYIRNTCCQLAIHIHLKGTVDYQIFLLDNAYSSQKTDFYGRLIISPWNTEDSTDVKAEISVNISGGGSSSYSLIHHAVGVFFKSINFSLSLSNVSDSDIQMIKSYHSVFIDCDFTMTSSSLLNNSGIVCGFYVNYSSFIDCSAYIDKNIGAMLHGARYIKNFTAKNTTIQGNHCFMKADYIDKFHWEGNFAEEWYNGSQYDKDLIIVGESAYNINLAIDSADNSADIFRGGNIYNSKVNITGTIDTIFSYTILVNCNVIIDTSMTDYNARICSGVDQIISCNFDAVLNESDMAISAGTIYKSYINISGEKIYNSGVAGNTIEDCDINTVNCGVSGNTIKNCTIVIEDGPLYSINSFILIEKCDITLLMRKDPHTGGYPIKVKSMESCNIKLDATISSEYFCHIEVISSKNGEISDNIIQISADLNIPGGGYFGNSSTQITGIFANGCKVSNNSLTATIKVKSKTHSANAEFIAISPVSDADFLLNNIDSNEITSSVQLDNTDRKENYSVTASCYGILTAERSVYSGNKTSLSATVQINKHSDEFEWYWGEEICSLGNGTRKSQKRSYEKIDGERDWVTHDITTEDIEC